MLNDLVRAKFYPPILHLIGGYQKLGCKCKLCEAKGILKVLVSESNDVSHLKSHLMSKHFDDELVSSIERAAEYRKQLKHPRSDSQPPITGFFTHMPNSNLAGSSSCSSVQYPPTMTSCYGSPLPVYMIPSPYTISTSSSSKKPKLEGEMDSVTSDLIGYFATSNTPFRAADNLFMKRILFRAGIERGASRTTISRSLIPDEAAKEKSKIKQVRFHHYTS